MKTEQLDFGRYTVEILKKKIKNIYFRIYPSKEKIIVSAPLHIDPETLNNAIRSKRDWIFEQVKKGAAVKPNPPKAYADGEAFKFRGKTYPLCVCLEETRSSVYIACGNQINLVIKPGSNVHEREKIITRWYREELRQSIVGYVDKWQPVMGVTVNEIGIRKMKTRWGSCNITARRIWLNFSLIKFSDHFLEYVVVHEMVHLLERKHNARFKAFMDQFIPDWRKLKKELNQFSL